MRAIFFLFISYIAAAPLTSRIEMDLTQTDWTSLWTYFFWLFSLAIWVGLFLAVTLLIAFLSDR